jgi:small GTP-binding protein
MVEAAAASIPIVTKKVVLLGGTGVGKTSIFNRIHQNEYIEENVTTMAAYFRPKMIDFPDKNCKVKVNLWDTAG